MNPKRPLTYKNAGVDIDAGNALVEAIKPLVKSTRRSGVMGDIGGFGGLFDLRQAAYADPILVAGTDGVGTKLKLAVELGQFDTVGIDLVAMCANDVIVQGAEPLFFLDYYAMGRLEIATGEAVIKGIAEGCRQAGAALLGGETAEMPGMYAGEDFDLAGFCVGVVERDRIIDGTALRPGDRLLGLASSGPHANGFSLIRRVLEGVPQGAATRWPDGQIGTALLAPTRIYVRSLLQLFKACKVSAIAHVTGGGLADNLARVLNPEVDAMIDTASWARPPVFDWLQKQGSIETDEMLRTFNCGIGMVVAVRENDATTARTVLETAGESVFDIGAVTTGDGRVNMT